MKAEACSLSGQENDWQFYFYRGYFDYDNSMVARIKRIELPRSKSCMLFQNKREKIRIKLSELLWLGYSQFVGAAGEGAVVSRSVLSL